MRTQRKTKIIATLGPATASRGDIRRLFDAGADVFCMDMRYGTHEEHLERYKQVREVERETGRPIGVLMDLQGPSLRIGGFRQAGVELVPGQRFVFDLSPALGDHSRVCLPYPEVCGLIAPGDLLCLNEGSVRLRVHSVDEGAISCRAEAGGFVRDGAYITAPNVAVPLVSLTARDEEDLAFGLAIGVDWIGLPCTSGGAEVVALRERIGDRHCPKILARIEKPSALEQLDGIVEAGDAVMVCRNGLGVELAMEEISIMQRRIVQTCRMQGRPVIIANQVLDSMIHAASPVRAEAGDVASAVRDCVDAILLSGETAIGKHGPEAVAVVDRIALRIEGEPDYAAGMADKTPGARRHNCGDAICAAVRTTADILPLSFAAACTQSGQTCFAIARLRPPSPILGLSPSLATARALTLVWGVHAVHMEEAASVEDMADQTTSAARGLGLAAQGRPFVMVAGMPFGTQGAANLMRIGWT